MKRYKSYLSEGGNVQLDGGHLADRIPTSDRPGLQKKILTTLWTLSTSFEKTTGLPIWNKKLFDSRNFFSGSSEHFFNDAIDDEDFQQHKPTMGDVDTQIDSILTDKLSEFLTKNKGKKFGDGKLLGFKSSPDTLISLFEIDGINIQIDFEMVDYENGIPTPWAKFSHSSAWEDITTGIKGVFHKYLIRAIDAKNLREAIIRTKTGKESVKNITDLAFSVGKGLRTKYEPYIENGKHAERNGLKVYTEVPTSSSTFVSDPTEMLSLFLGKKATNEEVKMFESFTGLVELINKSFSSSEKSRILDGFAFTLWGRSAQSLYRDDEVRDYKEKKQAFDYVVKKWKVGLPNVDQLVKEYYISK